MAKPMEYIVELDVESAGRFLEGWLNKTPNPARNAALVRAKRLKIEERKV